MGGSTFVIHRVPDKARRCRQDPNVRVPQEDWARVPDRPKMLSDTLGLSVTIKFVMAAADRSMRPKH